MCVGGGENQKTKAKAAGVHHHHQSHHQQHHQQQQPKTSLHVQKRILLQESHISLAPIIPPQTLSQNTPLFSIYYACTYTNGHTCVWSTTFHQMPKYKINYLYKTSNQQPNTSQPQFQWKGKTVNDHMIINSEIINMQV